MLDSFDKLLSTVTGGFSDHYQIRDGFRFNISIKVFIGFDIAALKT